MDNVRGRSIDDLPLSNRARNVLRRARIRTVGDLDSALRGEWQTKLRGMGRGTLEEIKAIFEPYRALLPSRNEGASILGDIRFAPSDSILGREPSERERVLAEKVPAKDLLVSTRAMNIVKVARCETLLDVALKWTPEVLNYKNAGKHTIAELKNAVQAMFKTLEDHVYRAEERKKAKRIPSGANSILGRALSAPERLVAMRIDIESLDMPTRAMNALKVAGCKTLSDAARYSAQKLLIMPTVGAKSVGHIRKAVSAALDAVARNPGARENLSSGRIDPHFQPIIEITPSGLRLLVEGLLGLLEDRSRQVLMDRHGLWDGVVDTLEDVGGVVGVTRERVRQIQVNAEKLLKKRAQHAILGAAPKFRDAILVPYLKTHSGFASESELLEEGIGSLGDGEPRLAFDFLCEIFEELPLHLVAGLHKSGNGLRFLNAAAESLYDNAAASIKTALVAKGRLMSVEDLAAAASKHGSAPLAQDYVRRCAIVSDDCGIDASGQVGLRRWPFFNAQYVGDMAQRALVEIGRPVHYSVIVETMNALFPKRAPFNLHNTHQRINGDERFVCVSRGTYGLANWGVKRPPFIKDFLAAAIRARGGAGNEEELVAEGIARYGFKDASLRMTLGMNPRLFRRQADGKFKLA